MLKHVHSSPHRSSSTSIRRNVHDQGSPKHIRQTPDQQTSPICITCSSKEHSKFSTERADSPLTVEDNRINLGNNRILSVLDEEVSKNLLNKTDRDSSNLSTSSNSDLQPVRLRTASEPPVICPKCFKKKRKPLVQSENNTKQDEQNISSSVVKEVEENGDCKSVLKSSSFLSSDNSLITDPSKESNTQNETRVSFSESIGPPRCSTPIENKHVTKKTLHPREGEENLLSSASSSPSSPSQSSASSVASSKSPFLRSKERIVKNDEKLFRGRLDNLSLDSSMSCSTSSREDTMCSLSSSAISLPDNLKVKTLIIDL